MEYKQKIANTSFYTVEKEGKSTGNFFQSSFAAIVVANSLDGFQVPDISQPRGGNDKESSSHI